MILRTLSLSAILVAFYCQDLYNPTVPRLLRDLPLRRKDGYVIITDPKRTRSQKGRSSWYPYYAGFSYDFAHDLLSTANLPSDAVIMDDWNGSGTTTSVANALGYTTYGFDLNPAMVVVAKARLLSKREYPSLEPLAAEIIEKACTDETEPIVDDPLQAWMGTKSAHDIRKLERAIQHLLIDHDHYEVIATRTDFSSMSGLCAFLYLVLFRTVRTLLQRFVASNPTWVKTPRDFHARLKPQAVTIFEVFRSQVLAMVDASQTELFEPQEIGEATINMAASESVPLANGSVNFFLGSPPYCTRIDYAVATKPELAVLGYTKANFRHLREKLLGTSTVPRDVSTENRDWGSVCLTFLKKLKAHKSKASETYYYKNHVQYFEGIFKSLGELHRVMDHEGTCVLVVQDSYYKDIRNDLPAIVIEMATAHALELTRREDFTHARTMAAVNPATHAYRETFRAIESVLVFAA
jgi:hypothetical protein